MQEMHSITLNTCAYVLLLSSGVTIVILLRKKFLQLKNTPLYILAVSDVLFSVCISSILFISCAHQIDQMNSDTKMNNSFSTTETMETNEINNEDKTVQLGRFIKYVKAKINRNNIATEKCATVNIIIKYGVLFFPFTNSFVSLLMFSVQCNINVSTLKSKCYQFLQSQAQIHGERSNMNECNVEAEFGSARELIKGRKISTFKQAMNKLFQIFHCDKIKKNKQFIVVFLVGQWVVPTFVIGLLFMSDYGENKECDIECKQRLNENISFFEKCCTGMNLTNFFQRTNSEIDINSEYKNYINYEDLRSEKSNGTQINEVISRVQNIVYAAMNNTFTLPFDISSNTSQLVDITEYLKTDTYTKITEQNQSVENISNFMENKAYILDESLDNVVGGNNNTYGHHTVQLNSHHDGQIEDPPFNNSKINFSKDMVQTKNQEDKLNQEIPTSTTEKLNFGGVDTASNVIQNFTNITRPEHNVLTNAEVYAEILKRIHNIPIYHTLQNYNKGTNQQQLIIRKKPKGFKLKESHLHDSTLDGQDLLFLLLDQIVIYKNYNISKGIEMHVTDECLKSFQYLKVHLLALMFLIYFLPILGSLILHQHGKLNCQMILEKLKPHNKIPMNNMVCDKRNEIVDVHQDFALESIESNTLKESCGYPSENIRKSIDKFSNISLDEKRLKMNMICEIKNMLKLFDTVKISLLSGILLWTPLFFELLVEVFTLLHVPEWLLNVTYVIAITFAVLRNIFNLKMVRLQDSNATSAKPNSIHPTM